MSRVQIRIMNEFTITTNTEKVGLLLEEESMVSSASIFSTRYAPRDFNVDFSIRISNIVSDINNLDYGDSENFRRDMKTLHYAIDYFSQYFQRFCDIMVLSKTQIQAFKLEQLKERDYPSKKYGESLVSQRKTGRIISSN